MDEDSHESETLDRADSTEQYADVDVTESIFPIHPSLLKENVSPFSVVDPNPSGSMARPLSSPLTLESHLETTEDVPQTSELDELVRESSGEKQLDVIAEVHSSEAESASASPNRKVVTVTIEPQGSFAAEEDVITVPFESAMEFQLEVDIHDSDC